MKDVIDRDKIMSNYMRLNGEKSKGAAGSRLFELNDRNYLFGYPSSQRASRESYSRYVIFMKIITGILNDFGIHMSNNGYAYIIDCVMLIIDMRSLDIRLNNDIYPYVAFKYDFKKCAPVEHSIRNAIKSAFLDYERCPEINRMGIFHKRPTNKQFLFYVAETVCRKMVEEMTPMAG